MHLIRLFDLKDWVCADWRIGKLCFSWHFAYSYCLLTDSLGRVLSNDHNCLVGLFWRSKIPLCVTFLLILYKQQCTWCSFISKMKCIDRFTILSLFYFLIGFSVLRSNHDYLYRKINDIWSTTSWERWPK